MRVMEILSKVARPLHPYDIAILTHTRTLDAGPTDLTMLVAGISLLSKERAIMGCRRYGRNSKRLKNIDLTT